VLGGVSGENNIPVVGRKEVINNREMSWIRIDRYFSGSVEDPQVVHQPIACQHCEQAPCEQVCPVGATTHSDEGLNDMAYNRCIGTRYCANNCPYKVRRFNFLDWNHQWRDARNKVRRLLFNPEVTVRMRGVMEKCTFCVQRIQNAKIRAKGADPRRQRPRRSTARCPTASRDRVPAGLPTEAIVFGDLSDKDSRVSRLHEDPPELRATARDLHQSRATGSRADQKPQPNLVTAQQGGPNELRRRNHRSPPRRGRQGPRGVPRGDARRGVGREAPKPHKAWLAALGVALIMFAIACTRIYVLVTTASVYGATRTPCAGPGTSPNFVWWIASATPAR